jgi:hypothetical protein
MLSPTPTSGFYSLHLRQPLAQRTGCLTQPGQRRRLGAGSSCLETLPHPLPAEKDGEEEEAVLNAHLTPFGVLSLPKHILTGTLQDG